MDLPDNYFRDRSPADIIAKVATITLANISLLGDLELMRLGWLNNGIIDRLYTLTSAGVWIARVNSSGQLTEANSSTIATYAQVNRRHTARSTPATIASLDATTSGTDEVASYAHHRIGTSGREFLSNAGGTLDADVTLDAALAGYYGVCHLLRIKPSQNVAAGATLIIQNGAGIALATITLPAMVANVFTEIDVRIFAVLLTDNSAIYIDTTSNNLGNATTFTLEYDYWKET